MKAPKSHPQVGRPRRTNNRTNLARHTAGLALALVGLISAVLLTWPIQLASAQTVALGWSNTGRLNTPRRAHTATLLLDGKVLVAGGLNRSGILPTAESYDPASREWHSTGELNVPRYLHTATLLKDGKILIVGGSADDYDSLNGAELYDPKDERWSVTGSLNTPRSFHTATLLKNGKVLVVGGDEHADLWDYEPSPLDTAELYDPDTGIWSFTGNLNTGVEGHTATLLQNGKVLVLGERSAELYDSDTGTWSSVGLDGDNWGYCWGHTATLLADGRVLLLSENECVLSNRAQLYDPETGAWSSTGHPNETRFNHTATLLPDGKVLVAGGMRLDASAPHPVGGWKSVSSAELYDPDKGTWSFAGSLKTRRFYHTATLLTDGIPLIVGGIGSFDSDPLNSVELGNTFAAVTAPKIARASVARKKLMVVGENFNPGAVILINGVDQKTRNDDQNPGTTLIGQNAGKKIIPGDRLQVRNADDILSEEFIYTGYPNITMAAIAGKNLIVAGENCAPDAVILINGEEQQTRNDDQNPQTTLIGKKASARIASGESAKLQVRNPNGALSGEFIFTKP